ncbi:MAG: penicillin-binding protein 2, partial [Actinomycetota bacterium]|nr:penicillin-binding protein 2 [Actinomycetota bacterium]MDQ3680747.1 penicillin-binding protein 2 [Actinomycetota bacterium]
MAFALGTMLVGFVLLAGRLVMIQGVAADRYVNVGESQRVRSVDLPAERGAIFDRNGHDLALTVRQSTITADPRSVEDPLATATALAPILGEGASELQTRLTRESSFVYLARKVDDDVAGRVKQLELSGIAVIDEPERFLPARALAAPLLGRVGDDNEGLSGLESQFEKRLAGRPGKMILERDPDGRTIPGGLRQLRPSVRGDDLVLTIDRSLQYEAERALAGQITTAKAKGGMAIVMETRTGEVLALANLAADPKGGPPRPADKNMALTNVYEPGSVNKMITISGALEEGLVRPQDEMSVPSTIKVSDHVFKEHDPHPVEKWSITEVMANSSNVGSIMIGQRLGRDRIDRYLRAFGFGQKTGLAFPGESSGILLDPDKWSGTSIGTIPIGQGVAVTAMQMLSAYNTVANGGEYVAPKLVKATVDTDGRSHPTSDPARRRVISARTSQQVTAMLSEVVRVGTGKLAAIDGYTVAGKTGTARKPLEGARGYQAGAYVSSFAGFVPAERPELSAVVMLDEPTPIFGGVVAAPVFAAVTRYGLRQLRIPPPPPAAPPVVA